MAYSIDSSSPRPLFGHMRLEIARQARVLSRDASTSLEGYLMLANLSLKSVYCRTISVVHINGTNNNNIGYIFERRPKR